MELKYPKRIDFFILSCMRFATKNIHHMTRIFNFGLVALASVLLFSCNEQRVQSGDEVKAIDVDSTKASILQVSGKLFSIPSPIQTALLIRNADIEYRSEQLARPGDLNRFQVKSSQAINLGIFGTNMAYASLYDDGQAALKYFKAVEALSNSLGISGALDAGIIKRLSANVENADSLLILSGIFFQEADNYLKENERVDVAAYVLLGGWVEATYLTAMAAADGDEAPTQRLAEQRASIATLIDVLGQTASSDFANSEVMDALKALHSSFNEVTYSYQYKDPLTDADKKRTTIKSTSSYTMDDDLKKRITAQVSALRELITA